MTLAGNKAILSLVGVLVVGVLGGASAGYVAGTNKQPKALTATPKPTVKPSPSPSLSIKFSPAPGAQNNAKLQGGQAPAPVQPQANPSEASQIVTALEAYLGRCSGCETNLTAGYSDLTILQNFAELNGGPKNGPGALYILKKVKGTWIVVANTNANFDPNQLRKDFGVPEQLLNQYDAQVKQKYPTR